MLKTEKKDILGFSHDFNMKKSGQYSLLYGVDINYLRFLISFGMTALLYCYVEEKRAAMPPVSLTNTQNKCHSEQSEESLQLK